LAEYKGINAGKAFTDPAASGLPGVLFQPGIAGEIIHKEPGALQEMFAGDDPVIDGVDVKVSDQLSGGQGGSAGLCGGACAVAFFSARLFTGVIFREKRAPGAGWSWEGMWME
jgi:hypothetical protein